MALGLVIAPNLKLDLELSDLSSSLALYLIHLRYIQCARHLPHPNEAWLDPGPALGGGDDGGISTSAERGTLPQGPRQ